MEQYVRSLLPETLCGHYISAEMKQVWNIQLNLAMELLRVCKKHNLRIWAVSGTMLGAVRHQGFIPWDDDMDFIMFREDYDKLQKIAPKEIKAPFFFQSAYTDKGYYHGHSQIRYSNSTMMMPVELEFGARYNLGIFIDIFVADGFPEDEKERNILIERRKLILDFLWNRHYPLKGFGSAKNFKQYLKEIRQLGSKIFWSDVKLYSYLEDLHRLYPVDKHKRNCCIQFSYLPRWVRRNEWFEEAIELPFEKTTLPVPIKYKDMLEHEFGDYMTPVKGTTVHGEEIIYPTIKYTEQLHSRFKLITLYISRSARSIVKRIIKKQAS